MKQALHIKNLTKKNFNTDILEIQDFSVRKSCKFAVSVWDFL